MNNGWEISKFDDEEWSVGYKRQVATIHSDRTTWPLLTENRKRKNEKK